MKKICMLMAAFGGLIALMSGCSTSGSGSASSAAHAASRTPSSSASSSCDPTTGCSLPSNDSLPTVDPALTADESSDDSTDPSEDSGPTEFTVGDALSFTQTSDDEDSTESSGAVRLTKVFAARSEPTEYGDTSQHGAFVGFRITITCDDGSLEYNPGDFYLASKAGDHYEDATYSDAWGASLSSGTLHTGERVRGTVVFDVPRSALKGARLYFSPNFDGDPLGYWKFSTHL